MNDVVGWSGIRQTTLSTDGSAIRNGWENASAGIGVWYAHGSARNIVLKLENQGENVASNSRAELGAILEALRQNVTEDLEIESNLLSSLRAICSLSERYEDLNWYGIQNADLLKGILIRLRTQSAHTAFGWVNDHPALQDRARLQDLGAKHIYNTLLNWHFRGVTPVPHQETLEEAKDKVEVTGLRSTHKEKATERGQSPQRSTSTSRIT